MILAYIKLEKLNTPVTVGEEVKKQSVVKKPQAIDDNKNINKPEGQ
jgi:hypothetical protein